MTEYGNVRVSLCLCGFYVISYEQTTQTIHLKHSQPLSVCLSCLTSSASSAGVQEAEVEGTRSQSPMCLPVAMGKPLATHTAEASTKLITAHQAHHCDDHPRAQTRDYLRLVPKQRAGSLRQKGKQMLDRSGHCAVRNSQSTATFSRRVCVYSVCPADHRNAVRV